LDGFPIALGIVLLVAQEASGWIRFALITTSHRLTYGDLLSVEIIPGWRNGPSWLRNDDDDNGPYTTKNHFHVTDLPPTHLQQLQNRSTGIDTKSTRHS